MPIISNFRQWRNGEVFNAHNYVYERNTIVNQLNRLTAILEGSGTPVDLTVDELTANSMTMNGRTITDFADAGNKTFLSSTQPTDLRDGDLWFDTSE
jgi:hypothetical protein